MVVIPYASTGIFHCVNFERLYHFIEAQSGEMMKKKVLPLTSKPTVRIYFESKTQNLRLPELLNYWKKPIFKILTDFISLTFQCFVSNSYFFDRNYYYTYSVYGPNEEVEFDRIDSVYYSQYQIFYTSQRSINFRTPYMKLLRLEDKFSYYPI